MKVYILFAENRAWWAVGSHLLKWVEKTNFSHVAVMLTDDYGTWVYESQAPQGRRVTLMEWLKKYKIVDSVLLDEHFKKGTHEYYYLYRQTQVPYSFFQLVLIGLGILNKALLERNKWLEVNGHKAAICTELVGNFLRVAYGVELGKSADLLGLQDIRNLVDNLKAEGLNVHSS
jgi:hypothetical protein